MIFNCLYNFGLLNLDIFVYWCNFIDSNFDRFLEYGDK